MTRDQTKKTLGHQNVLVIRLLLPTKSFRRTLLNHSISKVVHDLFSFRRKVLAKGPRLRQVRFGYFFA